MTKKGVVIGAWDDLVIGYLQNRHNWTGLHRCHATRFSIHSFRIGFACTLLAAGCDGFTIQALCRWKSPESLKVYARLNPDDYAGWITKAYGRRAESTTTRNLSAPTPS